MLKIKDGLPGGNLRGGNKCYWEKAQLKHEMIPATNEMFHELHMSCTTAGSSDHLLDPDSLSTLNDCVLSTSRPCASSQADMMCGFSVQHR